MAEGYRVTLNVYDLSQGLARQFSTALLGRAIEGIWHTGVAVYGKEYYFGGGIKHSLAGSTPYGTPIRVVDLGVTHIPQDVFESYLEEISPRYTAETYSLLSHNCNNFSNEVAQFLVGTSIPDYILQLPSEVMSSPMGALIMPMIRQLESTLRAGAVPQSPQFRPSSMAQVSSPVKDPSGISANAPSSHEDTTGNYEAQRKDDALPKASNENAPPTEPTGVRVMPTAAGAAVDPLGSARSKLQDEIIREFAAIMASGTLQASEAAASATRRVMARYGYRNVAA
ncbi:hypothetical protein Nepgr_004345 [Nepenthes gracilis]|uniref:PPPDE domain-containing protein n=1 Tax=Nepenthes gracilis TaxID=150966 RepID=A0AAD3XF80_NEPGR|nr:hypothetical protein Nepgr_004345 [Nepenthes gracilis]